MGSSLFSSPSRLGCTGLFRQGAAIEGQVKPSQGDGGRPGYRRIGGGLAAVIIPLSMLSFFCTATFGSITAAL
jgi:hypothetical protein